MLLIARRRFCSSTLAARNVVLPPTDSFSNTPQSILSLMGRGGLHKIPNHPIGIIKSKIVSYFSEHRKGEFNDIDSLSPVVTTYQNFDSLLTPADHPSRKPTDTYYLNKDSVLRCHTSAHQVELMSRGLGSFLCTGDVYRKDTVDKSHYPVFHQMEGVRLFAPAGEPAAATKTNADGDSALKLGIHGAYKNEKEVTDDLLGSLEGMVRAVFGPVEIRWVDAYFPFTTPSFEMEIKFQGQWLEVLGCGKIHPNVIKNAKLSSDVHGWAFGLGLERLAMVLFDIPDIRLFWSEDPRFLSQFAPNTISRFQSYSKYPACFKDISFWVNDSSKFHENDLHEIVRAVGGNLIESLSLKDQFERQGKKSLCFRINFQSMDRSLTNEEIDIMQRQIRERISSAFPHAITLR